MATKNTVAQKRELLDAMLKKMSPKRRARTEKLWKEMGVYAQLDAMEEQEQRELETKKSKDYKSAVKATGIKVPKFEESIQKREKEISDAYKTAQTDMIKAPTAKWNIQGNKKEGYYIPEAEKDDQGVWQTVKRPIPPDEAKHLIMANAAVDAQLAERRGAMDKAVDFGGQVKRAQAGRTELREGGDYAFNEPYEEAVRKKIADAIQRRELGEYARQESEFSKDFPESPNLPLPKPGEDQYAKANTEMQKTRQQHLARMKARAEGGGGELPPRKPDPNLTAPAPTPVVASTKKQTDPVLVTNKSVQTKTDPVVTTPRPKPGTKEWAEAVAEANKETYDPYWRTNEYRNRIKASGDVKPGAPSTQSAAVRITNKAMDFLKRNKLPDDPLVLRKMLESDTLDERNRSRIQSHLDRIIKRKDRESQ
tara:strand:+ start:129 stop:1397 length:1269 start_codon:yes stop_codon:yes gene_type:complete